MGVQLSSNAGSMVQWILTRHGTSMRKALGIWKVSTFFFFVSNSKYATFTICQNHILFEFVHFFLTLINYLITLKGDMKNISTKYIRGI